MIIVQTPLRISFLGGGTDFDDFFVNNEGAVLSTAINKYTFVILKERFDDLIYVNYSQKEIVDNIDKLKHELVREAMRLTGVTKGIEITTLSDIPSEGTGLGSSSSITVGLLHAFYTYQGELKTAETLAQEACKIEISILKKPIGRQDQYIAAYGNLRFIRFNNNGIQVETINLSQEQKMKLNEHLLLLYTGMTRRAESILTEQKANIPNKVDVLREMARLAFEGKQALMESAFHEFGELLHKGWELKKQLASNITNPLIEEMYKVARKAGALGGKILGAGGGGFLLLFCPLEKRYDVCQALKLRVLPFQFERDGSKVIFNYRIT